MNDAQTEEDLEGQRESKAQASVLQGALIIMMEPIILVCLVGKLLTIKEVYSASRFFARRPREIINSSVNPLAWKLVQVENKERGR